MTLELVCENGKKKQQSFREVTIVTIHEQMTMYKDAPKHWSELTLFTDLFESE